MNRFTLVIIGALALGTQFSAYAQEVAPVPPIRPQSLASEPATPAPAENDGILTPSGDDEPSTKPTTPQTTTQSYDLPAGKPQPVTLNARISDGGTIIPSGVEWRIYSTTPSEEGELVLLADSLESIAFFQLPAGQYFAHAALGRAQASDTITVVEGPNQLELILDVGGLQLGAAVSGDITIPRKWLRFTVASDSAAPGGKKIVAQSVPAGKVLHLNSGTYSVTSYFGEVNATAKADLQVEAGQLTTATLYHRASQVTFKLVSEPGGEAIADTSWIVKTLDGNTVYSESNAFPQTVLAEGAYILLAKLGTRVFNREFEIVAGLPREIEVLTTIN